MCQSCNAFCINERKESKKRQSPIEYLPEVRGLVRVRNNAGTLVLYHPPRRPEVQGNAQAVLLRREPVLGHQEIVLAVRGDQKDARDHELALTSPEPAWTEMCLLIPQDFPRRRREVPERALDVRRIVGSLRRLCKPFQRLCPQRVDVTLSHHAPPYSEPPQSLARVPLRLFGAGL